MAKKTKEIISYFEDLYANKAIYLWGANSQTITKELCDKLYAIYGSSTYNKTYYNNKFIEGKGKIGADCSGMIFPMSGFDTTAQGYYDKCSTKGVISKIDKSKPCLVFKYNKTRMNHIGFYCGNGYTIEMESSKTNCVKKELSKGKWTHYGIPKWIDYSDWNTNNNALNKKEIKGIDVSSYQGNIDWKQVAADNIKFVILRGVLKNGSMDTYFEKNYSGAKSQGLDISVYHFSYALNTTTAVYDAENLINKLNGRKMTIWLDLEWATQGALGKNKVTEIAAAYVKTCKSLGYKCNIYSNLDWYKNRYNADELRALGCEFWIARYGINNGQLIEKYKPNINELIWQYTSKGRVNGISGDVDMNVIYIDGNENNSGSESGSSSATVTPIKKLVKIITNSINVRTSPNSSSNSNICGVYKNEDLIEVIGITQNKSWYKDVNGNYFTANSKWVTDAIGTVYNCSLLNVRDKYKTGNIIDTIKVGTKLNLLSIYNGWYYAEVSELPDGTKTNGTKGWISGKYIKLN